MKSSLIPRLFLFAVCCAVLGGCKTTPSPESSANDEAGIRAAMDAWTKAFEAKDANAIDAMYAPEVVAYDLIPPLQYSGKDAYMKDYRDFFAGISGPLHLELSQCKIATSGDLGYAFCLEHAVGTMTNGQKLDTWLRSTSIFHRVDGKWLDVHDHVSVPADMATGKAQMDLKP